PSGWSNGPFTNVGQSGAVPTVVTHTPDGPEVRLPLEAGQFGVVHAAGPVPALDGGGLRVTATADAAGRISGTVHNPTPFRLEEVAIFTGSDATMLGTLDAGERRGFALLNTGQFADGAEFRVWAGPGPGFGGPVQGTADFGLWEAATAAAGPNFRAPGAVVAAGWTRAFEPEIRLGSRTVRPEGRTLVVAREQVGAAPEASLAASVHREVVRDPFANRFPGGRPAGTVVRFILPDGADTSNLVLRSPFGAAELWEDGAWRPATCDPASCQPIGFRGGDVRGPVVVGCPPGVVPCPPQPPVNAVRPFAGGAALTVPPASVRDGVLYTRVQGPVSFGPGVPLTLDRSA
ncbi:MAG TPA: hypothetical protein VHF91_03970, partial [Acidimicrobiales bacterium]|nr:hypothetical protein [Acidimicrobiales bacterium]